MSLQREDGSTSHRLPRHTKPEPQSRQMFPPDPQAPDEVPARHAPSRQQPAQFDGPHVGVQLPQSAGHVSHVSPRAAEQTPSPHPPHPPQSEGQLVQLSPAAASQSPSPHRGEQEQSARQVVQLSPSLGAQSPSPQKPRGFDGGQPMTTNVELPTSKGQNPRGSRETCLKKEAKEEENIPLGKRLFVDMTSPRVA